MQDVSNDLNVARWSLSLSFTTQKMKFYIKDFFSKSHLICRKPQIWTYLLKKFLIENFMFYAVLTTLPVLVTIGIMIVEAGQNHEQDARFRKISVT